MSTKTQLALERLALAALVLVGAGLAVAHVAPRLQRPHAGVTFRPGPSSEPARPPARARGQIVWCGTDRTGSDRVPNVERSSRNQVRVVYAVAADGADRFAELAPGIATDVAAIDAWWQRHDPTRTLRFDLFAFPGCTTRFGMLDLTFVRLPRAGSAYLGFDRFALLEDDLAPVLGPQAKTIVYLDGPVPPGERFVCGLSYVSPREGGRFGLLFVPLGSMCPIDLGQGRFTARVAAHELLHNLGAQPVVGPPNACRRPDQAGHPCDSPNDVLYPTVTSSSTLDGGILDVNRDDYYGHSGSWWDVQDSDWLIRLPQFPLTVRVVAGAGRITSEPDGISCPPTCAQPWDNGLSVRLSVAPADGMRFAGWGGACSGLAGCTVSMDEVRTVTAAFAPTSFTLAVLVRGRGSVTSRPAGIACPTRCTSRFDSTATVRLVARPAPGYRFAGWSGACAGHRGCSVRLDANRRVRARFARA